MNDTFLPWTLLIAYAAVIFVINPGLIHAYGWAGVVGYGMAAPLGIFIGLVVTSKRFRRVGDRFTVLTVPQWLGERYGDRRLTVFFAFASMLQITFLVLIVTALVLVLMSVLHWRRQSAHLVQ
jgi:SSS family solute:Na+ symporter/sodium/pantothenate symporter